MERPDLRIDDCCHCACFTELSGYTRERAIQDLENGTLGCDNCMEDQETNPDGHTTCVVLFEDDVPVWDGRCRK